MRAVTIKMDLHQQARAKSRCNSRTCGQCPKFGCGQNWCPILARTTMPVNEACAYGYRLIASAKSAACQKRAKNAPTNAPKKGGVNGRQNA